MSDTSTTSEFFQSSESSESIFALVCASISPCPNSFDRTPIAEVTITGLGTSLGRWATRLVAYLARLDLNPLLMGNGKGGVKISLKGTNLLMVPEGNLANAIAKAIETYY